MDATWFDLLPYTDRAEQAIRGQLAYVSRHSKYPRSFMAALIVTNYVTGHLSPPLYGHLRETGQRLPTGGIDGVIAERALTVGAGLCGQAASLAMVLYGRLGVPARQLDVLYSHGGHTTTEVRYLRRWHWFDPIFGYYYQENGAVLSLIDVLRHPDPESLVRVGGSGLWPGIIRQLGLIMPIGLDLVGLPSWRVTRHSSRRVLASKWEG